jgi:hypothetical protein
VARQETATALLRPYFDMSAPPDGWMEIEAQMREGLRASFLEGTKSTREAKLPWSAAVSPPDARIIVQRARKRLDPPVEEHVLLNGGQQCLQLSRCQDVVF